MDVYLRSFASRVARLDKRATVSLSIIDSLSWSPATGGDWLMMASRHLPLDAAGLNNIADIC